MGPRTVLVRGPIVVPAGPRDLTGAPAGTSTPHRDAAATGSILAAQQQKAPARLAPDEGNEP